MKQQRRRYATHVMNYVMPSLSVIGWSACATGSQQRTACNNSRRSPHSERCNWTELQRLATLVASSRFARTCNDSQRPAIFVARRCRTTSQRATQLNWTELLQFSSVQFSSVASLAVKRPLYSYVLQVQRSQTINDEWTDVKRALHTCSY